MKELKEMTIPKLQKLLTREFHNYLKLERKLDEIRDMISKKRLNRHGIEEGDFIVGRAIVFNKTRSIVTKVASVCEDYANKIKVRAYTGGDKVYEFDINKVRKAKPKEIEWYIERQTKYQNKFKF